MNKISIKILIGIILGFIIYFAASAETSSFPFISLFLFPLWGVGTVFAFRSVLRLLKSIIDSAFKISIISWLSLGSGIIGLILLVVTTMAMITFAWIYGYYVMYQEIHSL